MARKASSGKSRGRLSKRENPRDPKSRVGKGGAERRRKIDEFVDRAFDGQTTDSNN